MRNDSWRLCRRSMLSVRLRFCTSKLRAGTWVHSIRRNRVHFLTKTQAFGTYFFRKPPRHVQIPQVPSRCSARVQGIETKHIRPPPQKKTQQQLKKKGERKSKARTDVSVQANSPTRHMRCCIRMSQPRAAFEHAMPMGRARVHNTCAASHPTHHPLLLSLLELVC